MSCERCKRYKETIRNKKVIPICQLTKKKVGFIRRLLGCKCYKSRG